MKTRAEVEALKRDWQSDPIWDLGHDEGFEEYWPELEQFQRDCEAQWAEARQRRKYQRAEELGIPGNFALLDLIESLEWKIKELNQAMETVYFMSHGHETNRRDW